MDSRIPSLAGAAAFYTQKSTELDQDIHGVSTVENLRNMQHSRGRAGRACGGAGMQVLQLEMERFSLSKGAGTDKATAGRKAGLDRQLKQLKKEQKVTRAALTAGIPHQACNVLTALRTLPYLCCLTQRSSPEGRFLLTIRRASASGSFHAKAGRGCPAAVASIV